MRRVENGGEILLVCADVKKYSDFCRPQTVPVAKVAVRSVVFEVERMMLENELLGERLTLYTPLIEQSTP